MQLIEYWLEKTSSSSNNQGLGWLSKMKISFPVMRGNMGGRTVLFAAGSAFQRFLIYSNSMIGNRLHSGIAGAKEF